MLFLLNRFNPNAEISMEFTLRHFVQVYLRSRSLVQANSFTSGCSRRRHRVLSQLLDCKQMMLVIFPKNQAFWSCCCVQLRMIFKNIESSFSAELKKKKLKVGLKNLIDLILQNQQQELKIYTLFLSLRRTYFQIVNNRLRD